MKQLALSLPGGFNGIKAPPGFRFANDDKSVTLGFVLGQFFQLAIYIAGFMMVFWFAWGAYEYILSRGNKEGLAKARNKIWWSLLGFIILVISLFISQYIQSVYFPKGLNPLLEPISPTKP